MDNAGGIRRRSDELQLIFSQVSLVLLNVPKALGQLDSFASDIQDLIIPGVWEHCGDRDLPP